MSSAVQTVTIPVTLAAFRTLNSVPLQLLPSPGANNYYVVLEWHIARTYGSAALVGGGDIYLTYAAGAAISNDSSVANYTSASSKLGSSSIIGFSGGVLQSDVVNKAINLQMRIADFTVGTGSTFNVRITYYVQTY